MYGHNARDEVIRFQLRQKYYLLCRCYFIFCYMLLPNLAPNRFQEIPFGTSRMQENVLAAGAPPQISLGSQQRSPDLLAVCPIPSNLSPALGPLCLGLRTSPLARNMLVSK